MDRQDFDGSDDLLRPLTESGEKKTRQAMEGLSRWIQASHDSVRLISSEAVRARRTAEIFARAYDKKMEVNLSPSLNPGANALDYLEAMIYEPLKDGQVLLIFGHEPEISETCSLMANVHRIRDFYARLWGTEPNQEVLAEMEHWLPSDDGETTVVEGSLAFQVKKASAVILELDEQGACIQGILPPAVLRALG